MISHLSANIRQNTYAIYDGKAIYEEKDATLLKIVPLW